MRKAQRKWEVALKVLMKTGAMVWAHMMMYNAVVQTVLICGSESWVVTELILKDLEGFHNKEACKISGMSGQ